MKAHAFNFLPFWAWLTEEVVARERGTEILPHAYCFSDTLHLASRKSTCLPIRLRLTTRNRLRTNCFHQIQSLPPCVRYR